MRSTALLLPLLLTAASASGAAPLKTSLTGPAARGAGALWSRRAFLGRAASAGASLAALVDTRPANAADAVCAAYDASTCRVELAAEKSGTSAWKNYKFKVLSHKRQKGYQKIKYGGSKVGTTEFLIVSLSHGNNKGRDKPSEIKGGDWGKKTVYAGDDDRSVEIWSRDVTDANRNDLGKIDTKYGKGAMAILAYKKGLITPGRAVEKDLKKDQIAVKNKGGKPWLVSAVSDNGKELDIKKSKADKIFGASKDDPCFVYITTEKDFKDKIGKNRGAIGSIELK